MKFSKFFLFSALLFLVACKKDEKEESNLVGTWNLAEVSCTDGTSVTTGGGQTFTSTFTSTGKDYTATVTFKDDGTYTSQGSYTAVLTITYFGQTIEEEEPVSEFVGNGTWEINGNTLTVTDSQGVKTTAQIEENSDSKFKYKVNLNETETDSGVTVTTKGTFYFTLTR